MSYKKQCQRVDLSLTSTWSQLGERGSDGLACLLAIKKRNTFSQLLKSVSPQSS